MSKSARIRRTIGKVLLYLFLTVAAITMLFPLYTGIVTSLLGPDNVSSYPPSSCQSIFAGKTMSMLPSRRP